jgi:hypothetical protein
VMGSQRRRLRVEGVKVNNQSHENDTVLYVVLARELQYCTVELVENDFVGIRRFRQKNLSFLFMDISNAVIF